MRTAKSYAVSVDGVAHVWMLSRGALAPTGRVRQREQYYDGVSIRVRPDGELSS